MKHTFSNTIILALLILLTSACNNSDNSSFIAKPTALGKRNKITVIADNTVWEGSIRDSFETYFGASYPIMPQPEPIFDIRHFTIDDLSAEPLRKNLRIYVVLSNLQDKDSKTTKMLIKDLGEEKYNEALKANVKMVSAGVDKWAHKQLIVYLYGNGEEDLAKTIRENFPRVAKRINQHDQIQLASNTYAMKIHHRFTDLVLERYGFNMNIPGDYKEAKYDSLSNVTWFRKDSKTAILNLSIQSEKYTNKNQFSKEYVIAKRDSFGKKYVSTNQEGSYMVTNIKDLPIYEYDRNYGKMQTKEIRGIWEIHNDFVGGPYISYALYNKSKGEIIYIDCFILNKGKSKRDHMQEMEYIVKSMDGAIGIPN